MGMKIARRLADKIRSVGRDRTARSEPLSEKKLAFESLEQRILLTADISSAAEVALSAGLNDLKAWTAGLDDLSDFTQQLPITQQSIGSQLDIPGLIQDRLITSVQTYFAEPGTATTDGLVAALDALPDTVGVVLGDLIGDEYFFELTLQSTRNLPDVPLDLTDSLGSLDFEIPAAPNLSVDATLNLDFGFGYDTSINEFFVRFNSMSADADVNETELNYNARLGFIEVSVGSGDATLDGTVDVVVTDPNNSDAKNYITQTELTTTPVETLAGTTLSGTAALDVPMNSTLVAGGPTTLQLDWADVGAPAVVTDNLGSLGVYAPLATLTEATWTTGFSDLTDWTELWNDSIHLGQPALLIGSQLAELSGPAQLFDSALNSLGSAFNSAQSLETLLSGQAAISNVTTTVVGNELFYTLDVSEAAVRNAIFDWTGPGLVGLHLDTPLALTTLLTGSFTLGVDLGAPTPAFFLATDQTIAPEFTLSGSIAIDPYDAEGGIGFLELDVNGGTADLNTTVTLELNDGTPRIGSSILTDLTSSVSPYILTLQSGTGSLNFPLSSVLLPGAGTQVLTAEWTDFNDPSTFTSNGDTITVFDGYEQVGASAYSLGLNYLEIFINHVVGDSLVGTELTSALPLINQSLDDVFGFESFLNTSIGAPVDLVTDPQSGLEVLPFSDSRDLRQLLEALPGVTSVIASATANDISFDINQETAVDASVPLDMQIASGVDFEATGSADLHFDAVLNMVFGVSTDSGLFYVETKASGQDHLEVTGSLSANVDPAARLGFLDVDVVGATASMPLTLGVRITDSNEDDLVQLVPFLNQDVPASPGKITASELAGTDLTTLTDIALVGTANISLPLSSTFAALVGDSGTLTISWADVNDPATFIVDDSAVPGLSRFANVTSADVLGGLAAVPDVLAQLGDAARFGEDLPLIGSNLQQVLGLDASFQATLDGLGAFNTLSTLQSALDSALGGGNAVLQINGDSFQVALSFGDIIDQVLGFSVDTPVNGYGFQFSGSEQVTGSIDAGLTFGLGTDAGLSTNDRFYLLPGTDSVFDLAFQMMTTVPFSATATLGLLTVSVNNGTVDVAGRTSGVIDKAKKAKRRLSLVDPGVDGKVTLGDILADPLAVVGTPDPGFNDGAVEVVLPFDPLPSAPGDNPSLTLSNNDLFGAPGLTPADTDLTSFYAEAGNFDPVTANAGIQAFIDMVSAWLTDAVLGTQLPFIDTALSQVFDFGAPVTSVFNEVLAAAPTDAIGFDSAIQAAPVVAGFAPADASIAPSSDPLLHDPASGLFYYDLVFDIDSASSVPFGFSLGGDLFSFNATLDPAISFDLNLSFGLNPDNGFFIVDTGPGTPELTVAGTLDATFNSQEDGLFGPLAFGVNNGTATFTGLEASLDLVDPSNPGSGGAITVSELDGNTIGVFDANLGGTATLNLPLGARLGGDDGPGVTTTFSASWDSDNPSTFNFGGGSSTDPRAGFSPIKFELGEFVKDLVGPVLDQVDEFNPLPSEIVDLLTETIPIIDQTPIELLGNFAGVPEIALFFEILDVINDLSSLADGFSVDLSPYISSETAPANPGAGQTDPNDYVGDPTGDSQLGFLDDLRTNFDITLPIFDDIQNNLIDVFMGEDIDLIRWNPDVFEVSYDFPAYSIPVFTYGIPFLADIHVDLGFFGSIGFFADPDVGLSTHGLLTTGNLFDGFFLGDNNPNGDDDPFEIGFKFAAGARVTGAGRILGFDIVEVYGEGGLQALIGVDISDLDPNPPEGENALVTRSETGGDNRIHLDEAVMIVDQFGPDCLFHLGGALEGVLTVGFEIDLLFFSIGDEATATFPIVQWEIPCNAAVPTQLVSQNASALSMSLLILPPPDPGNPFEPGDGKEIRAFIRKDINGTPLDMRIEREDRGGGVPEVQTIGLATLATVDTLNIFGTNQSDLIDIDPEVAKYFEHITVDADAGHDTVYFGDYSDIGPITLLDTIIKGGPGSDLISATPVFDTIYGGDGGTSEASYLNLGEFGQSADDVLIGFGGNDVIYGDVGNDQIVGGDGLDMLFGEAGDDNLQGGADGDEMHGGDGFDKLFGDDGNDTMFGDADRDEMFGVEGDDEMHGGGGNDLMLGGIGVDTVSGDAGDDEIYGDQGDDIIDGGDDNDILYGNDGADLITGNAGNDVIQGNDGNDILLGGTNDDTLMGNAGEDILHGNQGNDILFGGVDSDDLFGESGNDTLSGDGGDDDLFGNEDNDTLYGGGGSDLLHGNAGLDTLYGEAGADMLFGDSENDELHGGGDRDHLYGGSEDDLLYGEGDKDYLQGEAGSDRLFGGESEDLLWGHNATGLADDNAVDYLHGDYGTADTTYGTTGNPLLAGSDRLLGQGGNDFLYGEEFVDYLYGGTGADTAQGGEDDDFIYGEAGDDQLFGDAGNDLLSGAAGADSLYGGADNDYLLAGIGLGKILSGGSGDDRIVGADQGSEDGNFFDTVFFGDVIDGGSGNDTIWGLAGADIIKGGGGNDVIDGGSHGDYIQGEGGGDTLWGGVGADLIEGGAGTDTLYGGGGDGDTLKGGDDDDVLYGSGDGADNLFGESGDDRLFGNGGNDNLSGGLGSDILDGGLGDDVAEGDAGSDVLLGGADHDTLYGHSTSGAGDDNAVDYLYGDFGTNLNEVGSGQDQLFGQGGNDFLFGEDGDDFIDVGAGASNLSNYGAGEGVVESDFVAPTATPAPSANTEVSPYAGATLPSGEVMRGRWTELAGSASQFGLSGNIASAAAPAIVAGPNGPFVAWADARNGSFEIYVAEYTGGAWQELAGSASFGGVSNTALNSARPFIALDAANQPVVAWTDGVGNDAINVAQYDPTANGGMGDWVALGTSLDPTGINGTGAGDHATIVNTAAGLVVAWIDGSSGTDQVYVKRFNGSTWSALGATGASGTGASQSASDIREMSLITDGTKVAISWVADVAGIAQVFVREFNGASWVELAGSGSGAGLSNTATDSEAPSLAYFGGDLFAAWQQKGPSALDLTDVFVARYAGTVWVAAGTGALSAGGVSNGSGESLQPQLAAGGGALHLVWADYGVRERPGATQDLYAKVWNGTQFIEELPGDAQERGVTVGLSQVTAPSLSVDASGHAFTAFVDDGPGRPSIYVRANTFDVGTVFNADGITSIQDILDANDLGPGDVIVAAPNTSFGDGISVIANDAGVLIVGAPDLTSNISSVQPTTVAAADVVLQRLNMLIGADAIASTNVTLIDNTIGLGAVGLELGGASDAHIVHNVFGSINGIQIDTAASGYIGRNAITAVSFGLTIDGAFTGLIEDNDISGASTGVNYNAPAALSANRIHDNTTGVHATVSGDVNGFGFVGPALPNAIYNNVQGVVLGSQIQNQHIYGNTVGVTGSGILGGNTLAAGNLIENNTYGVQAFDGTIQFNRFTDNTYGIDASTDQKIFHNVIDRSTIAGIWVTGVDNVQIVSNTLHAITGDNIRLQSGASGVEIRDNIAWAESGYDIYVANDSQAGFFSDYNILHSSGSGELVYWTRDFGDILDWQADLARFDLHSIGHTVVNPLWSRPAFFNSSAGDYRVFGLTAGLRFTSPTVDSADPRTDLGAPTFYQNLLANPGFETGLTDWTTNVEAGVQGANPDPFDGSQYLVPGATLQGFASQTIDLLSAGFSAGQLDSQDFELIFGGRIRSLAESPIDRGQIELTFKDGGGGTLSQVISTAANATDRWDLAGERVIIPGGTRQVEFRFVADRVTGTDADSYLDGAFVYVIDSTIAPNLGAYGNTAIEEPLSPEPHLALRFPDLYADWERDKPLTISWDSFGNTADSPIRIDLYQDGPDGPALLTTITAATPDDGEFVWIPSSDGIGFATPGLRIQISHANEPLVMDSSTEPFTVPEDGTVYWVDDATNSNDEYTPGAIGDNRNTGKLATAPKPSPVNLLRTYELGAGDILNVDTGTYPLYEILAISGSIDRGLGLDEGFTFRGPVVDPNKDVVLETAIPGDRFTTLMELDDADSMVLHNLTLPESERGLWVHNGSDNVSLSYITAYDHHFDGIRIETNSPGNVFDHLTVYDVDLSPFVGTGIYVLGEIGGIADSLVHNTRTYGLYLEDTGDAFVQTTEVYGVGMGGSGSGLYVDNNVVATTTTIGSTNLAAALGNRVHDNATAGIHAIDQVLVSGNTVYNHQNSGGAGIRLQEGAVVSHNIAYQNWYGIDSLGTFSGTPSSILGNRVYLSTNTGIRAFGSQQTLIDDNVVYGNPAGIRMSAVGTVSNNVIYDNTFQGLFVGANQTVINNTFFEPVADALVQQSTNLSNVIVRNNIFDVGGGYALNIPSGSQAALSSDFNLFHTTGSGQIGLWQGVDRSTLGDWKTASVLDANSQQGDPLFIDPVGTDDFHVQSQFGSFHGGSLAPVLDVGTGLPLFPIATETVDAGQSPAIDRADAGDGFANEPASDGGYRNIGAYGDTAQASKSPVQYVLVLAPEGSETLFQDTFFDIDWRSFGFADTVDIEYSTTGPGGVFQSLAAAEVDDGQYQWLVDSGVYAPSSDYVIRISASGSPSINDDSNSFAVAAPVSAFYVNDGSLVDDEYATAIGNDSNDGLTPSTPKANLGALLSAYSLGPDDVVFVDTGIYALSTNIQLIADDAGVEIRGPVVGGHAAVLDRGNTSSGSYVFQFTDADDVTLSNLEIMGANIGVYAGNGLGSTGLILRDSDIHDNQARGVEWRASNDNAQMLDNRVHDNNQEGVYLFASGTTISGGEYFDNGFEGIDALLGTNILVDGVEAYGNSYGILIRSSGNEARNNTVHGNRTGGITASENAQVIDNSVYSNTGIGINLGGGADASGNIVYDNIDGISIFVSTSSRADGNRVYANLERGIYATTFFEAISDNAVYGNGVGVYLGASNGTLSNNRMYDNADQALLLFNAKNNTITNNTIHQTAGDTVMLDNNSTGNILRDNILWSDGGTAVNVSSNSHSDLDSNYNLFYLTNLAQIGSLGGTGFSDRAAWFFGTGLDQQSVVTDPQFVNPDGVDGIFGFGNNPIGAAQVIDNSDAGFNAVGSWFEVTFGGVNGSQLRSFTSGDIATWTYTGLAPGTYEVAATWASTDAGVFSVFDGTTLVKSSVTLTGSPNDFNDLGVDWERVGTVDITGTTLVVQVTVSGFAGADATRIQHIPGDGGSDDDFHLQLGSPGIDRGDPASALALEPAPDGGRINVGAYGNTTEATVSAAEFVQILSPNGLEKFEQGQAISIDWRAFGLSVSATFDLEYSTDGGANWTLIASSQGVDGLGNGSYLWNAGPESLGDQGLIRATANEGTLPQDISDEGFMVANAGTAYYINNSSLTDDEYTTAIGDNANSGKDPSAPMESLLGLLNSYDLDPGDTIFVDTGIYSINANILIGLQDSGVLIQGPVDLGHAAVLDRNSQASGSYVFELTGATDVTLKNLEITDAYVGVFATSGATSTGLTVQNSELHDLAAYGVQLQSSNNDLQLIDNLIYDYDFGGAYIQGTNAEVSGGTVFDDSTFGSALGLLLTGANGSVHDVEVYGNRSRGIDVSGAGGSVYNNVVYDNGTTGIIGNGSDVHIFDNTVYGHSGTNDEGIRLDFGADASGNTVYDNWIGIEVTRNGSLITDNRVFRNLDAGIAGDSNSLYVGVIADNRIYSNPAGIRLAMGSTNIWQIHNNVIYNNPLGLVLDDGAGHTVTNNTFYQTTGDAVTLLNAATGVDIRDNIFHVDNANALNVAGNSQTGFASDYNLFELSGSGTISSFGGVDYNDRATWFYETGLDQHSVVTDPQFVDADGADDILGYNTDPVGAAQVIDNSDVGFDTTGTWSAQGGGFNGGHLYSGTLGSTATWTYNGLTPGTYQVAATWIGSNSGLFTIFDGAIPVESDISLASSPDDFSDLGANWERISTVDITGTTLAVQLDVNFSTRADAIRIQSIAGEGAADDDFHLQPGSPGIDRGDPASAFALEPAPDGGRVNVGAYGNTTEATVSAVEFVQVLSPNGLEKFEQGQAVSIDWRAFGLSVSATFDLEYSADGGANWTLIAVGQGVDGSGNGSYAWTAGPESVGSQGLIRITANEGTLPLDISDEGFVVANAGTSYYVNDGSLTDDEYTTAIGDNANSGKDPSAPMASLLGLLNAYDLDPGDTIFVDTGIYSINANILIGLQDSGVTIQGPVGLGHTAVLDRNNQASGSYVFEMTGATDVTLANLEITNAFVGVYAGNVGSTGFTLDNSNIHAHGDAGVWFFDSNDNARFIDNQIHDNAQEGLFLDVDNAEVSGGSVFNNFDGIWIDFSTSASIHNVEVQGNSRYGIEATSQNVQVYDNIVHDNGTTGIFAGGTGTTVTGNTVYGHSGSGDIGIFSSATTTDNVAYGNWTGISFGGVSGSILKGNRSFSNLDAGFYLTGNETAIDNISYSNSIGILVEGALQVASNLVYDNTNAGVLVNTSNNEILSNTIYQSVGDALAFQTATDNSVYNNILWVDLGNALVVDSTSQSGFVSDFNLFYRGIGATGDAGSWGGVVTASLVDWQTASGQDASGLAGDPVLLDIDGADNVFGGPGGPTGSGEDDNFNLAANSPAIDAANSYKAPFDDLFDRARHDDPATPNTGIGWDLFVETDTFSNSFTTTGTQQFGSYTLPFAFPLYGDSYTSVQINQGGYLHFAGPNNFVIDNSLEEFKNNVRIAPLWDQLSTSGGGIFVDESVANQVTIRWEAFNLDNASSPTNFSVTLFDDGNFRFNYGTGNTGLTPTIGVSAGNGVIYELSTYDDATTLTSVNSVQWTAQTDQVYFDIGALEFQGDSSDVVAPQVTGLPNLPSSGGSTDLAFTSIPIDFSESLEEISARSPANFTLISDGPDNIFDNTDDIAIAVDPGYVFGGNQVVLQLTNGPLPNDNYRLTLTGTATIFDTAGNPLDGDANGVGGDDFVHLFTIDRSANTAPVADAQALNVNEDGNILITLSGSDLDFNTLSFSITGSPSNGSLGSLNPVTHEITYTPNPDYNGPDSFTFEVDDGKLGTSSATISLTVDPVNEVPVANVQAVGVTEGGSVLIVLTGSDLETFPTNLTFAIVDDVSFGTLVQNTSNTFTYTPSPDFSGPDSFTFTVTDRGDPDGALANAVTSAPATVNITVQNTEDPPIMDPIADQVIGVDSTLVFTVTANDADALDILTFSLDSAPVGATLNPLTGEFSWTSTGGFEGTVSVTVRVTDDSASALFDFKSFDITVSDNNAPVLDPIGNKAVEEGSLLTFTANASDPDLADILTYSLDGGAPAGASIDANSGVFTWTPTEAQGPGMFNVTVRVTDDGAGNLDDFEVIQITVNTPTSSADFDDSGLIDGFDFLQWQRGFGTTSAVNADGDADYDADVDGDDLVVWESQYGQSTTISADFDDNGLIDGFDFLQWQRGFGTASAVKADGDADHDTDVDGDDLIVWESQYGQPAPIIAAVSSPVVETFSAEEPISTFQVETTAPLASTPDESVASRFPVDLFLRLRDVGLGFSLTASQHEPIGAEAIVESIDEAFNSLWPALPEQYDDLTSDEFVLVADGDSTKATQSDEDAFALLADEVFALLADDEDFAGL